LISGAAVGLLQAWLSGDVHSSALAISAVLAAAFILFAEIWFSKFIVWARASREQKVVWTDFATSVTALRLALVLWLGASALTIINMARFGMSVPHILVVLALTAGGMFIPLAGFVAFAAVRRRRRAG
jgi:hypothetical protein